MRTSIERVFPRNPIIPKMEKSTPSTNLQIDYKRRRQLGAKSQSLENLLCAAFSPPELNKFRDKFGDVSLPHSLLLLLIVGQILPPPQKKKNPCLFAKMKDLLTIRSTDSSSNLLNSHNHSWNCSF